MGDLVDHETRRHSGFVAQNFNTKMIFVEVEIDLNFGRNHV